ncbi:MAG: response regulator [Chryseosolibacter sp.]
MTGHPIIFYADDDSDDRTWVKESVLKKQPSAELKEFEDGTQLLHFLRNVPDVLPDLVILDINMPGMSGKDVLKELRNNSAWNSLKVVMFTNSAAEVDRLYAKSLNASFITKPMSLEGIRKVADDLLKLCR